MGLRKPASIALSADLAKEPVKKRSEALAKLREFLEAHDDICGTGRVLDRAFDEFKPTAKNPDGKTFDLKAFADVSGVEFEPEVIQGDVTDEEKEHIESMGFRVSKLSAPAPT